jgi:hypothetical protein
LAKAVGPQDAFIAPTPGTTTSQGAVDDNRRNRPDAQTLGTLGHSGLFRVVDDNLIPRASPSLYQLDSLVAHSASSAEHFDLSFFLGVPLTHDLLAAAMPPLIFL